MVKDLVTLVPSKVNESNGSFSESGVIRKTSTIEFISSELKVTTDSDPNSILLEMKLKAAKTVVLKDNKIARSAMFINLEGKCVKVKKLITFNLYQKKGYKVIVRVKYLPQDIDKKEKLCYN